MSNEPTLGEVLAEIKESRTATLRAVADVQRNLTSQLRLAVGDLRSAFRDLEGRVAAQEAKSDLTLAQIRRDIADLREIAQELLNVAHAPDQHDG